MRQWAKDVYKNKRIFEIYEKKKENSDQNIFQQAIHCSFFGESLEAVHVSEQSHFNGGVRGIAQEICNASYRTTSFIPTFFQKGSNNDFNQVLSQCE